ELRREISWIRRAVACLPAPGSASSRTGTSLCESSLITASTGRMLALTLSTKAIASPQGCLFPVVIHRFRKSFPHMYAHRLQAKLPESVEVASLDARELPKRHAAPTSMPNVRNILTFNRLHCIPVIE